MLDSTGMARRKDLRPIDETRRSDGTLTSETAMRLLRVRGGKATAKKARALGFPNLRSQQSINKARLTMALKARPSRSQEQWQRFRDLVLRLLASEHPRIHETLTKSELLKLI